jgi:hypothetical protein
MGTAVPLGSGSGNGFTVDGVPSFFGRYNGPLVPQPAVAVANRNINRSARVFIAKF